MCGWVYIAHYNDKNVFINLQNELDYNTILTQQRMTIEGKLMRIEAWTLFSLLKKKLLWILLPGLPQNLFKKTFLILLLKSVGKVLYLDTISIKRSREEMTKVKMQIDLTKPRPRHVWVVLHNEEDTLGI